MKRPLTLIGFIISTVMLGIDAILELIGIAVIIELLSSASGFSFVAVILLITVALIVVSLVFNAIGIAAWNKSPEAYRKKRGMVITAIVLNFVIVLLMLISIFMGSFNAMSIILMLALVAANVLALVDLAREKNKVASLTQNEPVAEEAPVEE